MKVAAIQHDIAFEDAEATRSYVDADDRAGGRRRRPGHRAHRDVRHRFFHAPERIAEDEGGPSEQFLIDQARQHKAWLIASVAQRGADGRARNNAVVAGPDGPCAGTPRSTPSATPVSTSTTRQATEHLTVDIDGLRATIFVCYDLRFADEFWALRLSTDLYVVPANWPEPRRDHWRALLRARAIENQAYVVGVNRVGAAKEFAHVGDCAIIDPLGRTLAEASVGRGGARRRGRCRRGRAGSRAVSRSSPIGVNAR